MVALNKEYIRIRKSQFNLKNMKQQPPSKTSGAIHAALPLLFVMWVWASHAVPKSQIFSTVPPLISSRLMTYSNNTRVNSTIYYNSIINSYSAEKTVIIIGLDW